jgi:hypothetical protein
MTAVVNPKLQTFEKDPTKVIFAINQISKNLDTVMAGAAPVTTTLVPEINITDPAYGAIGDGTTNNDAALTAAVADLGAQGGTIYFPAGKYKFSAQQTFTYPNSTLYDITLRGDGQDATELYWATGNGILANLNGNSAAVCNQSFHMRDLSVVTGANNTGTGVKVSQTGTVGGAANAALSEFTRVTFRGDGAILANPGKCWAVAASLAGVNCVNLNGCLFSGTGPVAGVGVAIAGLGAGANNGVVFNAIGCSWINNTTSLSIGNHVQGVTLTSCNITDMTTGIVNNGTSDNVQISVVNCQFGANNSSTNCIVMTTATNNLSVVNSLFIMGTGSGGIVCTSTENLIVTGTLFTGGGSTATGISLSSITSDSVVQIVGNQFATGTGINIVATTANTGVVVKGNGFLQNTIGLQVAGVNATNSGVVVDGNQFIINTTGVKLLSTAQKVIFGVNQWLGNTTDINNAASAGNQNWGLWEIDSSANFAAVIRNSDGSAGSHGIAICAGANAATDNGGTVMIDFLSANRSNVVGFVNRVSTGIAIGGVCLHSFKSFTNSSPAVGDLWYNGTNLLFQTAAGTQTIV